MTWWLDNIQARMNCETWQDAQVAQGVEFPYVPLDRMCESCQFVCKHRWRFYGLTGKSGKTYYTAPSCPVLWKFHPRNLLAQMTENPSQRSPQPAAHADAHPLGPIQYRLGL